MYIKAIHITGFRSYRDRTVIDDFSRRFNVVVGQNGSGKSNFFAAIQFVLSEEFAHLSAEDRQNLLHEGTGNRSTVANVEIVFDNSDRRLAAFESHEFVISRQITAKKDQYFIDGRLSTRAEISSLMEAAGFSRSNPYYIVKQGKIAELAVATDLTRLKLLREVAGTRIYDEKKRESMDLLIITDDQIAKSKVLLNYMDDRLVTLEEEKEELKEYQRCDKIRRALEYTLLNGDVRECKKEFDHCMRKRQELQMTLNEAENTKFEKSKAVNAAELEMRTLETREKCLVEEKNNARAEEDKFKEQRDFSVMKTTDLQELVDRVQHGKDDSEKQLTGLSVVIKQKEDELKALKPKYEELVKLKAQYEGDYNIASRKLNNLYAKSDNSFASVEERDKYLKQKIIETQNYLIDSRKHIEDMQQALNDERETMNSAGQRITEIEMQINEHVSRVDTMINEDDENRSILNRKTQVLHRKVAERRSIQERISELEAQNDHLNSSFHQSLPKSTADGIRSVDSILADLKLRNTDGRYNEYLNGYHGIVIKLMESDSQYFKALETTAGGNLAYHVVDTVEIALYLLQQMNDRHLRGEANFFPLNRVFSPELRDLRDKSNGRPLLSVIKYDHKFHAVFRQIFGGTILVKDIAAGRAISRNERFDCITLDGDQVSSAGPMTGGYVDIRKSKLDIVMNIKKIEPEIYELKERYKALTNEYVREENEVENLKYALQKNDEQRELIRRTHEQISTEKRELTEMRQRVGLNIERGNEDLLSLHRKSRELEAQIAELNRQIGTSLQDESIKEEIQKASDESKEKGQKFNDVSNELSELAVHKKKLESELNSCLYRRREEYVQKANAIDFEVKRNELQNSMMETKKLQEQVAECYQRSLKLQDELGEVRVKILELRHNLENLVEQRNNADEIITNNTSEIEGLRRKMTELMKKRDESNQKLKDLGTLPVDMITQFAGMRKSEIEEQWRDSRKNLSKYNNINRKALDQYVRSATERDELKNQIVELEKSHEQISKLLEATETRKYDVLYLTFKQVAKNFHDVFNKLVPQGAGDLVMKTAPIDQNDPDALEKTRTMHVMERFIGVAIRVNFNDTSAEGFREAITLSGGQKTLVALGLIFAIQKCDPAPFYLFDEIDAALDREKRAAVASLIDEFSCSAQFISTTFRPEMLVHANRCYGVRFRNKISYISLINPDDAVEFLSKDDEIEETNHQSVENMDVM